MVEKLALTILDAAAAASSSRTAIYAAIACGELRAVKRGRRTLIIAEDLRRWLANLPAMKPSKKLLGDIPPAGARKASPELGDCNHHLIRKETRHRGDYESKPASKAR